MIMYWESSEEEIKKIQKYTQKEIFSKFSSVLKRYVQKIMTFGLPESRKVYELFYFAMSMLDETKFNMFEFNKIIYLEKIKYRVEIMEIFELSKTDERYFKLLKLFDEWRVTLDEIGIEINRSMETGYFEILTKKREYKEKKHEEDINIDLKEMEEELSKIFL